jgi:hypothetical protein
MLRKVIVILLSLCIFKYISLVTHRLIKEGVDIIDKDTWLLKPIKKVIIPEKDISNGINKVCVIEPHYNNTFDSNGILLEIRDSIPCAECKRYIYKSGDLCKLYKESNVVDQCILDNTDPMMCPFKNLPRRLYR